MTRDIPHINYCRLIRAILLDDATAVAELAYSVDDLNWVDDTGRTVLHIAVMHRRDKVVAPLLSAGADVSIVNEFGMTPLGLALHDGAETISRLLQNAEVSDEKSGGQKAEDGQVAFGQLLSMEVHINPGIRYVNLRKTPDHGGRVVATAVPGTVMRVMGVSEAWVEVELEAGGARGWAHRDWLDLPLDAPIATPETTVDQVPSNDHKPPAGNKSEH